MSSITFDDLIYIHDSILQKTGGLTGIRDEGVIRSALSRPSQTAFGKEIHADTYSKAAALLEAIANNHGFIDGNKRTAMAAASLLLYNAEIDLAITNDQYESFMIKVVTQKPTIDYISSWLEAHSKLLSNSD